MRTLSNVILLVVTLYAIIFLMFFVYFYLQAMKRDALIMKHYEL